MAKIPLSNTITKLKKFKNCYLFQKRAGLDFSLSENPLVLKPTKALIKSLNISKYPVEDFTNLKKIIANKFGLKPANICLGNGLEQIIDVFFRTVINPGNLVVIPLPSFFLFEKGAVINKAGIKFIKPTENIALDFNKILRLKINPRVIIFANPNNPTGQLVNLETMRRLLTRFKNTFIVVDEAGIDFGGKSALPLIKKFDNLIIFRTFSKGLSLAGIRLGFAAGNTNVIKGMELVNQPLPINVLSLPFAKLILNNQKFIIKTQQFIKKERGKMVRALKQIGIKVFPGASNNILIKVTREFNNFLEENNVSLVDCSAFRGLKKGFFRISIRSRKENKILVNSLKMYYK